MKKVTFYFTLFLLLSSAFSGWMYNKEKKERQRLEANQSSLLDDVTRYRTSDSLNVLSVQRLQLTNREFKEYNSELVEKVDELNLKVKRLQSVISSGTITRTEVVTEVKDKIVYRDKERLVKDTFQCLDYISPYLTLQGCIYQQEFQGLVISRDTLDQFIHRVPRQFLFIKFGTKGIRQEIYSRNPHTEIVYSSYIELK